MGDNKRNKLGVVSPAFQSFNLLLFNHGGNKNNFRETVWDSTAKISLWKDCNQSISQI